MNSSEDTVQGGYSAEPAVRFDAIRVRVLHCSEVEDSAPLDADSYDSDTLARGELVIVRSRYGPDLGRVLGPVSVYRADSAAVDGSVPRKILRRATDADIAQYRENRRKEAQLFTACRELAADHAPDMKPLSCHIVLGEPKLVLFYGAETRIDFRALLKAMNATFRMRVELRQIGSREIARHTGGLGPCGRPLCCSELLLPPPAVTVKMAKAQCISVAAAKSSGACGRLFCCLAYEQGSTGCSPSDCPQAPYSSAY